MARRPAGSRVDRDEFVDAFCDIFWPNPPMADLIPRLKANGYRLVLASNTNAAHYERYREEFKDTLAHFHAIAVSHEAGARKPHAQVLRVRPAAGRMREGRVPVRGRPAGQRGGGPASSAGTRSSTRGSTT